MGRDIAFDTPLGSISGWRADPMEAPRGALVVVQEIFGVNAHMRSVADRYAAEGYVALAPAFFDPVERGVELGYDEDGFARGRDAGRGARARQCRRDRRSPRAQPAAWRRTARSAWSASAGAAPSRCSQTCAWACRR